MGKRSGKSLGKAFQGNSTFVNDENKAVLEDAFEEAARRAADQGYGPNTEFDVAVRVKVRKHNQHVRVYSVVLTPHG